MRYLLLIHHGAAPTPYSDPEGWANVPAEEQRAIATGYEAVGKTPGVTPGEALQPAETATTVRVEDGKVLMTDGPFVSLKEALGGFFVYEAEDLDAAIELAARIPAAQYGGAVEIRPLVER